MKIQTLQQLLLLLHPFNNLFSTFNALSFSFLHKLQIKLECEPMRNVTAALPNIGGALCSTPQSLADTHCWTTMQ